MSFNPNQPHNSIPKLPPKKELETKAILKKTITASRSLAALKGQLVAFQILTF